MRIVILATGNNNGAAGGLIGAAQNDQGAPLTIENCVVNANITGKGKFLAGGLIGSVSWSNAVTIKKCIAMGSVSNENGKGAGGLVDQTEGSQLRIAQHCKKRFLQKVRNTM